MTPAMPDPTPLSPLAGIEQNITDSAQWFSRHAAVNASRIATRHAETLAHAVDYLAELGKVLEEWRAFLVESRARVVELASYTDEQRAAIGFTLDTITAAWDEHVVVLLSTPTSPREPRGKE